MSANIVLVSAATHDKNKGQIIKDILAAEIKNAGGEVKEHDLAHLKLPVMDFTDPGQKEHAGIKQVRDDAGWANGFIFISPEYHGNMAGALKNWFDFLYLELAGKTAGVAVTSGGGSGDMTAASIRTSFMWCHGFVVPMLAAARSADFDDDKLNDKCTARVQRLAQDVVRYAPAIYQSFEAAKKADGVASGFAGV